MCTSVPQNVPFIAHIHVAMSESQDHSVGTSPTYMFGVDDPIAGYICAYLYPEHFSSSHNWWEESSREKAPPTQHFGGLGDRTDLCHHDIIPCHKVAIT